MELQPIRKCNPSEKNHENCIAIFYGKRLISESTSLPIKNKRWRSSQVVCIIFNYSLFLGLIHGEEISNTNILMRGVMPYYMLKNWWVSIAQSVWLFTMKEKITLEFTWRILGEVILLFQRITTTAKPYSVEDWCEWLVQLLLISIIIKFEHRWCTTSISLNINIFLPYFAL